MKLILISLWSLAITGCGSSREVQVEMVRAELIKIDTVFRHSTHEKKMLTWKDQDNIQYFTYISMLETYNLGINMTVLRRR